MLMRKRLLELLHDHESEEKSSAASEESASSGCAGEGSARGRKVGEKAAVGFQDMI